LKSTFTLFNNFQVLYQQLKQ